MIRTDVEDSVLFEQVDKAGWGRVIDPTESDITDMMYERSVKPNRRVIYDGEIRGDYYQVSLAEGEVTMVLVHNLTKKRVWLMRADRLLIMALKEGLNNPPANEHPKVTTPDGPIDRPYDHNQHHYAGPPGPG